MSIVQVKGSGGSVASDRLPFYGARVPKEIRAIIKPLSKIDRQTFKRLLILAVSSIEGKNTDYEDFVKISTDLTEEQLSMLYMGIYTLLRSALRLPLTTLKPDMFLADLKDLNIPDEFQADLSSAIFGTRRPQIDAHSLETRPRLPRLDNFSWRVDVGISTSVLNRVLEPSILMEMTLSDGNIHIFEVPVSKFHQLRYNVAFVLKEMEDLEKKSILQIQD